MPRNMRERINPKYNAKPTAPTVSVLFAARCGIASGEESASGIANAKTTTIFQPSAARRMGTFHLPNEKHSASPRARRDAKMIPAYPVNPAAAEILVMISRQRKPKITIVDKNQTSTIALTSVYHRACTAFSWLANVSMLSLTSEKSSRVVAAILATARASIEMQTKNIISGIQLEPKRCPSTTRTRFPESGVAAKLNFITSPSILARP